MMRIAEYKQTGTKLVGHVEVPVMSMVYRDATPEEEAAIRQQQEESLPTLPTPEERLAKLEAENADLKEALELLLSGVTDDG